MAETVTSCGVIVAACGRVLLGQASRSPRWDIPKGIAEAGEAWPAAALRELFEETGLIAAAANLVPLGSHAYLPRKQLALFAWRADVAIDPAALRCTSMVEIGGRLMPELARFALLPWDEAMTRVGKNMARVLGGIGPERAIGSNR